MKKLALLLVLIGCSRPSAPKPVAMDSLILAQRNRINNSTDCLSKAKARRLTIKAVPDSAYVNPTNVPIWPYDTVTVVPQLHDPATGETWIGTECQVWTQLLDIGMGAAKNYAFSVHYPDRRYRILFAVMTPTNFGWYGELFARDTAILISPRPGWTP